MAQLTLGNVCDIIIIIGALTVAVTNIWKFMSKPASKIKQKVENSADEEIRAIARSEIEECLCGNNKRILDELQEIKTINAEQSNQLKALTDSSKDMLRQRIMAIYNVGKKSRTLTVYQKEALDELYKDYKAERGNSYIDKYYNRMKTWLIVDDDTEDTAGEQF